LLIASGQASEKMGQLVDSGQRLAACSAAECVFDSLTPHCVEEGFRGLLPDPLLLFGRFLFLAAVGFDFQMEAAA
jgi:hypothetical protein